MSIYDFSEYTSFLRAWIAAKPKRGRGEIRRMADVLGVNPALISQALSGEKCLSLELTADLVTHLGLTEKEADYFILLVEYARAGSVRLKQVFKKRIVEAQKRATRVSERIQKDRELSDETKSVYYSSWTYTGIRNLTAIEGMQDIDSIATRLKLPKPVVSKVVSFLLEHGLCRHEGGHLTYGPMWTHVPADSPLVVKHHQNWRLRGFTTMEDPSEAHLFFTSPMSLSREAAEEVRKMLPSFIEKVQKIVGPSPSETVRCLNIDWFEY